MAKSPLPLYADDLAGSEALLKNLRSTALPVERCEKMQQSTRPPKAREALETKSALMASSLPTFEHIMPGAEESFIWRKDDYPWERNVWNIHPEIEIHLIRKSSGMAFVGDYIGEFHAGYLTVVGPNLPHDWVTATEPEQVITGRDIVIQFDPERLRRSAAALPEFLQLEEFFRRSERGLVFSGETLRRGAELIEGMGKTGGMRRFAMFIELLELLSRTEEYECLASPAFAPKLDSETLEMLQRALIYIFENVTGDVHIGDLARLTGMSDSAFSRFFKKNTGNTFTEHVNKLRLLHACRLLGETDMPITDICFEAGYMNISNFNRTFLKHHRITPSAYRRLAAQRRPFREDIPARERSHESTDSPHEAR